MIALPEGQFAVRTDAVDITSPEQGMLDAQVMAVEYQGTHVSLSSRITGDQEVTALISDAAFFANPHHPGDRIGLRWDANDQHKLTA